MTALQYCLSSNSYKNKIFAGFSQLQKDEELVDLTLAADGCFVKVHRNIIALASPYLKQIFRTMSDHSPVIFLHNVSQEILSYLLEYIYQGSVNIPEKSVNAFIEVSKSLYIAGIEDLEPPKEQPAYKLNAMKDIYKRKQSEKRAKNVAAHITINDNTPEVEEYLQPKNCDIENLDFYADCNIDQSSNTSDLVQINTETSRINPVQETDNRINDNWIHNPKIIIQKQHHTDISNQVNTVTVQNIPVIEITTDNDSTDLSHADTISKLKDYKIILKSQDTAKSSAGTPNVPTIVIQPIELSNEGNSNLSLQGTNTSVPIPVKSDCEGQTSGINRHAIKIIDDQILKRANSAKNILKRKARANSAENNEKRIARAKLAATNESVANKTTPTTEKGKVMALDSIGMNELKNIAQYSVTERSALQLILNRFIYCCHHSALGIRKRRWRCIDYRHKGCPAIVDTLDGDIVARKGNHEHPYHDGKIYKKNKNNLIYRTMLLAIEAMAYKAKEAKKVLTDTEIDEIISDSN